MQTLRGVGLLEPQRKKILEARKDCIFGRCCGGLLCGDLIIVTCPSMAVETLFGNDEFTYSWRSAVGDICHELNA
jgi:hypothetical protein